MAAEAAVKDQPDGYTWQGQIAYFPMLDGFTQVECIDRDD